jgi:hypothetical protein
MIEALANKKQTVSRSISLLLLVGYLLDLLFHPEDGDSKFLRNVGELLDYT